MKRIIYYMFAFVLSLGVFSSCTDDDALDTSEPIFGLGGDEYEMTELDLWIQEEFTKPYNIAVKYRWNPWEVDLTSTIVPVKEELVQPVMELIRDVWIEPYKSQKGLDFIKQYAPKNYVLVGSPRYNTNGTITLGEAEGGNRITIYRVNWWDPTNHTNTDYGFENLVPRILKTIHHEFTHTLNQIVRYPESFMGIAPYESAWTNVSDAAARDKGYISPYASDSPGEDFAEMVSMILVYGRDWFNARVAAADNTVKLAGKEITARQALQQKETIVINYLHDVWDIDLYTVSPDRPGMHELVQTALKEYMDNI
ncbi:MAG: putative zinc-binding metallopeptidase [Dysgonamonadaceae bacterium]|nr:putative zinc-binding metallopeptidase [Dysgonamonadaceae bacterium]